MVSHNIDFTITTHEDHALRHFREFQPDIVVFDLIQLDDHCINEITELCRTVSLSPIFNGLGVVDEVFHRSAIRGKDWPTEGSGPVWNCSLDYAIISHHCEKVPTETYQHNLERPTLSVAISMGGGDAANKTLQLLERLKDIEDRMIFWALLGEGYAHSYENLVRCTRDGKHEIILAKTNESMWRILNSCSLLILAGGTTTYEAAYAGIPSINTLQSADHFFLIEELVQAGACRHAGYTFEESLAGLRGAITRLNRNRDELSRMHCAARSLIDGKGAARVANQIMSQAPMPVNGSTLPQTGD